MECRGCLVLTDAATLLDRLSNSLICSSKPADASTWDAVKKLTELAAACIHMLYTELAGELILSTCMVRPWDCFGGLHGGSGGGWDN